MLQFNIRSLLLITMIAAIFIHVSTPAVRAAMIIQECYATNAQLQRLLEEAHAAQAARQIS